jgi:hypothetical protein
MSGKGYGIWNVQCGIWKKRDQKSHITLKMRNFEFRNLEFGIWNSEFGIWNGEWQIANSK